MTEFRARRQDEDTVDTDLFDVIADRGNVFDGSEFSLLFTDTDGTKEADYPRGQKVEIEYSEDGGSTWNLLDYCSVFKPDDTDKRPRLLTVKAYDYGHYLRKSYVDRRETDTLSDMIQTIVENDTPLTYAAGNVTVDNDSTETLNFRGLNGVEAMDLISRLSNDEEFGVNQSFEFFFASSSPGTATAIDDSDRIRYELPNTGDRGLNKVVARYGNGAQTSVEDSTDQSDLQSELGAPRAVELVDEISLPNVTEQSVAEARAQRWLDTNTPEVRGQIVVPLSRFDADPGDNIDVTIDEKGISAQTFTVAGIKHESVQSETTVYVGRRNSPQSDLFSIQAQSRTTGGAALTGATGGGRVDVSADYTTENNQYVSVDTSSQSVTVTLATADAFNGNEINIKRNGTNRLVIDTEGSATVEGGTDISLDFDGEAVTLVYNPTNTDWEVF